MRFLSLLLMLTLLPAAHAAVYHCTVDGKRVYADKPCVAGDAPADLPALTTTAPVAGPDLAKAFDARIKAGKKIRDKADAAFVKDHEARVKREQQVRTAILDHRVIRGMTRSEVESALGSPDGREASGRWEYHRDGQRVTVIFDDQVVRSVTSRADQTRRAKRHR